MIRGIFRTGNRLALLALLGGWCTPHTLGAEAPADTDGFLVGYLEAFNSGDARSVGAFWAADASSVSNLTGRRLVGREAIVADYQAFFAESPGARLAGGVDHVRSLGPELSLIEGRVTLFLPDAEPEESGFTAVVRRGESGWEIESAHEHAVASPVSPYEALQPLAWLVGEWRDEVEGVDVATTVRWSPSKAFLIRSFSADFGDGDGVEGTQIFGWDASAKRLRTWVFQSDGSFGEGTVSNNGDAWLIRMSHVGADGELSTGTQVITRVDEDEIRVQAIGRTTGGSPAPASDPVTVVRVPSNAAAASAGGGN